MNFPSDGEKPATIRQKLCTPVVSDALDRLGYTKQAIRHGRWGKVLSTAARMRGAIGTIVDGFVRDVRQIVAMSFPTFARGIMPRGELLQGRLLREVYERYGVLRVTDVRSKRPELP